MFSYLPFNDYIFSVNGPKAKLTSHETFADLYLLPFLVTVTGIIFYYFSKLFNTVVKPIWIAVIFEIVLFFFIVYLIDRLIELWRLDNYYSTNICPIDGEDSEKEGEKK